jgi:hypothetical protein
MRVRERAAMPPTPSLSPAGGEEQTARLRRELSE